MTTGIDVLTAPTLKHVRDEWWDDTFTEFLAETLRPRPGNRILDVGCGQGEAEVSIGRLQMSSWRYSGSPRRPSRTPFSTQPRPQSTSQATFNTTRCRSRSTMTAEG